MEEEVYYSTMMKDELEKVKKACRNQKEIERCCEEAHFRMDEFKADFEKECSKNKRMDVKIKVGATWWGELYTMQYVLDSTFIK